MSEKIPNQFLKVYIFPFLTEKNCAKTYLSNLFIESSNWLIPQFIEFISSSNWFIKSTNSLIHGTEPVSILYENQNEEREQSLTEKTLKKW